MSIKTVEQQDIQAAHRIRSELVDQRTAKANQIRGLVGEYSLIAPVGIGQLRKALPKWLEDTDNGLRSDFRCLLRSLEEDLHYLDGRVQHSTGGKNTLLGISKRGDSYLRKLLIHGARSVIRMPNTKRIT